MEYLTFPFEIESKSQHDDEDDGMFKVAGYASTFGNTDLLNDVVQRGAFSKTIKGKSGKNIKVLWQHDISKPIGKINKAVEDEKGLFIRAVMPKDNSLVQDVMSLVKAGVVDTMSIGFTIPVDGADFTNGGKRILKEINLHEVSLVTFPANPKAVVTDMKRATTFKDLPLAPIDRPFLKSEVVKRLREFTGSKDKPSSTYRNAFFWWDETKPDLFASYKLIFADVVGGELKAIPRGIFSRAGIMLGARGGVDIPDADRPGVIRHMKKYYEKMGRPNPFDKKCFDLDHVKAMDIEDIKYFILENDIFEEEDCKYFLNMLELNEEKRTVGDKVIIKNIFKEIDTISRHYDN